MIGCVTDQILLCAGVVGHTFCSVLQFQAQEPLPLLQHNFIGGTYNTIFLSDGKLFQLTSYCCIRGKLVIKRCRFRIFQTRVLEMCKIFFIVHVDISTG